MTLLPQNSILGQLVIRDVFYDIDGPKLFSCESRAGALYLAFWLGDNERGDEWLYLPISRDRLQHIAGGGLSLHDACTTPEDGHLWRLFMSREMEGRSEFEIHSVNPGELRPDDLPHPDSVVRFARDHVPPEVLEPDPKLYAQRALRDIVDVALSERGGGAGSIGLRLLGNSVLRIQGLLESILAAYAGFRSRRGRVPDNVVSEAQLLAIATYRSSFGLRLEAVTPTDLYGDLPISRAISQTIKLIEAGEDEEQLGMHFHELGGRVASKYVDLLTVLESSEVDVRVVWASPVDSITTQHVSITAESARSIASILTTIIERDPEEIVVHGRLEGLSMRRRSFDFYDTVNRERITGSISDELIQRLGRVDEEAKALIMGSYTATIRLGMETNRLVGESVVRYELLDLHKDGEVHAE